MEMKQVIVTGGAGYIGSHTVVELHHAGFTPVILDNFINSDADVLKGIEEIIGYPPSFFEVDCTSIIQLREAFEKITAQGVVEGIIHFAAFKAVGESTEQPLKYYQNNLGSTTAILQVMQEHSIKNFVFSSSCTVYGQPNVIPVDESAPILEAESPYGFTKQACERMIMDVNGSAQPLNAILLRYFNPIGAHPSAAIGELPIGHPNNLIPYLTQAVAKLREPLTVFGADYDTPDGTCIRDYIHVIDLAKAHVAGLHWLSSQTEACEVFNLGTGNGTSVLEIIEAFERANGIAVPYKLGSRRPGDVTAIYADVTKAKNLLDWSCQFTIEDALRDAWRWQQKLGAA